MALGSALENKVGPEKKGSALEKWHGAARAGPANGSSVGPKIFFPNIWFPFPKTPFLSKRRKIYLNIAANPTEAL